MNWLDILFIIILVVAGLIGLWKGLIKLVVIFVALFLSIIIAGWISQALASGFHWQASSVGAVWQILAFVGFLIVLFVLFYWVGSKLAKLVKWTPLASLNRIGGLGLGIVIGFTVCGFIAALLGLAVQYKFEILGYAPTAGVQEAIGRALAGSALVPVVNAYFVWFYKLLPDIIDKARGAYRMFG